MKRKIYNNALKGLCEMRKAWKAGQTAIEVKYGERALKVGGFTSCLCVAGEEYILHVGNRACSAGLRYSARGFVGTIGAVCSLSKQGVSSTYGAKPTDEDRVLFADWFLNRSPWAQCIVTNSPNYLIEMGMIIDADYPANLVVGATMAHRCFWESTAIIAGWSKFVAAGMDETAAFYVAHKFVVQGGKIVVSTEDIHCALSGHNLTKDTLKNFCTGKLVRPQETYSKLGSYDNVHVLFGDSDSGGGVFVSLDEALQERAKEFKENIVPNPFAVSLQLKREVNLSEKELLAALSAYINKIIGE
jgi:hypothetical protein